MSAMEQIGTVAALYRYPVKSMAGERVAEAKVGWHGLEGDRRFALRRVGDTNGFPWLTAGRWAELLRFAPVGEGDAPTHVRTPDGAEIEIFDRALADLIREGSGVEVEMTRLKHGIFDEAPMSVIARQKIGAICEAAEVESDVRRFRPNVLLDASGAAFCEDAWVSRTLVFGSGDDAPRIAVTLLDLRCSMIGLDPETAEANPAVLKASARLNDVNAGLYATVTGCGTLREGDPVYVL